MRKKGKQKRKTHPPYGGITNDPSGCIAQQQTCDIQNRFHKWNSGSRDNGRLRKRLIWGMRVYFSDRGFHPHIRCYGTRGGANSLITINTLFFVVYVLLVVVVCSYFLFVVSSPATMMDGNYFAPLMDRSNIITPVYVWWVRDAAWYSYRVVRYKISRSRGFVNNE